MVNAVGHPTIARSRPVPARIPLGIELVVLVAALALNWFAADALATPLFSWTSLVLLGWLLIVVSRISRAALILMFPFVVTRVATMVSLLAIEGGAYMPEVNQLGASGDSSASFVAVTAILFVPAALMIGRWERAALTDARSRLLDDVVGALAWPAIAFCLAWGAFAAVEGLRSGFPLLAGVDRFLYRRVYSGPFSLALLDNKAAVATLLGVAAFGPRRVRLVPVAATLTFVGLTGLFFLFGDKFFTILTSVVFFAMPLLLRRRHRLGATLLRATPLATAMICLSLGATLYIYSDYGRLPLDRTSALVGERIAGQGELWFVANRDARRATHWDGQLVDRYLAVLTAPEPAAAAFANGVETYWFIERYAPAKTAVAFRRTRGWVQLTMGTEAMALVMFGYLGVVAVMLAGAALVAFVSLYLLRAIASGFPVSVAFAVWTYLQVYFALQQASLWPIAAPGQVKRVLLFLTIELVLLAVNRGEALAWRRRASLATARTAQA